MEDMIVEFIRGELKMGKSPSQIRAYLLSKAIPSEKIDSSFAAASNQNITRKEEDINRFINENITNRDYPAQSDPPEKKADTIKNIVNTKIVPVSKEDIHPIHQHKYGVWLIIGLLIISGLTLLLINHKDNPSELINNNIFTAPTGISELAILNQKVMEDSASPDGQSQDIYILSAQISHDEQKAYVSVNSPDESIKSASFDIVFVDSGSESLYPIRIQTPMQTEMRYELTIEDINNGTGNLTNISSIDSIYLKVVSFERVLDKNQEGVGNTQINVEQTIPTVTTTTTTLKKVVIFPDGGGSGGGGGGGGSTCKVFCINLTHYSYCDDGRSRTKECFVCSNNVCLGTPNQIPEYCTSETCNGVDDDCDGNIDDDCTGKLPLVRYLFDETTGDIATDSRGFRNGTIISVGRTQGVKKGGLNFTGIGYVDLGTGSSLDTISSSVTLSAWIIPQATGGFQGIIMHGGTSDVDTYGLYVNPTEKGIGFKTSGTQASWLYVKDVSSVWDGNWHEITATYDGKQKIIYVDGKAITSIAASGSIHSGAGKRCLIGAGRDLADPTLKYTGKMDEVKIFDQSLSDGEVRDWYLSVAL